MKLRLKIPLILGLAIVLMSAVFFIFTSQKLLEESTSVERADIERDIQRVSSSLHSEIEGIMANTADYATWDATYAYMIDRDPSYISENYEGTSFVNLRLNIAAIFDEKNELIYKRGFDFESDKTAELPEKFFPILTQHNNLFQFKDITQGNIDLLKIDGRPMVITSRPILTSNQEGPSRGTLIMGRWLDQSAVEHLSALTQLKLSLIDASDSAVVDSVFRSQLSLDIPEKASILFVSENQIDANILLTDSNDLPVAILNIHKNRPTYLLTLSNLRELFGMTFIMCMITIFASLYLLDWLVLEKTTKLSKSVLAFDVNSKKIPHLHISGKDEISEMAKSIESVLQELAYSTIKIGHQAKSISVERDKLETILQSITEGVLVINNHQKIIHFNKHFSRLVKVGESFLKGKNFLDAVPIATQKGSADLSQILVDVLTKQKHFHLDDGLYLNTGSKGTAFSFSIAPLRKGHKVTGAVIVLRDITLEHEVDRMKSEFVSIASHQLRTPLTGIRWMLSLLMKKETGELNATQVDYLKSVQESNDRMIQLVGDLLDISRIENNPALMQEKTSEDIHVLVKNVMKDQENTALQRNIDLILEVDANPVVVEVNKDKMYQAFMNLISNSIKYSKDGNAVQIGTILKDKEAVLYVRDNGIGIPDDQKDKIFDKFFRANNAAKVTANGTGLGLYFAKQVVEAHNGKIWFESAIDKGTTFYISLPRKV
jgi:signal transduction histidine kinase